MASAPASESILFIAAVVAASLVASSLAVLAGELTGGIEDRADLLRAGITGRISIINDPVHVETSPLTLYVKNTGSVDLYLGGFTIFLDGQASSTWTATVNGSSVEVLDPGDVATIEVTDLSPGAGDHRVVVVADTGYRSTLEFTS